MKLVLCALVRESMQPSCGGTCLQSQLGGRSRVDLCKFKASLASTMSSRTTRASETLAKQREGNKRNLYKKSKTSTKPGCLYFIYWPLKQTKILITNKNFKLFTMTNFYKKHLNAVSSSLPSWADNTELYIQTVNSDFTNTSYIETVDLWFIRKLAVLRGML
jgi:hypothetical protein